MLSVWEYIRELKDKYKVFTNKQRKYLSHICIYTHELQVYKVVVWADPNKDPRMSNRKAKYRKRIGDIPSIAVYARSAQASKEAYDKRGNAEQKQRPTGSSLKRGEGKVISFPKLKKELDGSDVGYKMFIYNIKQDTVKCYEGEGLAI
jgi:hypothetical protein